MVKSELLFMPGWISFGLTLKQQTSCNITNHSSLQQLQLLELIRAGRAEEALAFASATLAEAGANDPNALTELERSLALLAFPDPHTSPFADLLLPSHSQKV